MIITIIILLILAGISISTLTGSGLFGKAKDSKVEMEIAREKEQIKMSVMSEMTNTEYKNAITFDELEEELKNCFYFFTSRILNFIIFYKAVLVKINKE